MISFYLACIDRKLVLQVDLLVNSCDVKNLTDVETFIFKKTVLNMF